MKEYKDTKMQVAFNKKTNEMIDAIKQKTGLQHTSEVIRMSILEFYRKFFKDYTSISSLGGTSPGGDKADICDALGGEIVDNNGVKSCRFMTYEMINPKYCEEHEQEIPFSMLTKKYIAEQFIPDKRTCQNIIMKNARKNS